MVQNSHPEKKNMLLLFFSIFVVFSAAWRGGFFGRFLSALETKKVGKKSCKIDVQKRYFLEDFFFSFSCFLVRQDDACGRNIFWTFSKYVGAKKMEKNGKKSENKVVQIANPKKKKSNFNFVFLIVFYVF